MRFSLSPSVSMTSETTRREETAEQMLRTVSRSRMTVSGYFPSRYTTAAAGGSLLSVERKTCWSASSTSEMAQSMLMVTGVGSGVGSTLGSGVGSAFCAPQPQVKSIASAIKTTISFFMISVTLVS